MNNKWVKSQKVVNFPFENFDPTPYLASVPQETILRHKELLEHGNNGPASAGGNADTATPKKVATVFTEEEIHEFDKDNTLADSIKEDRIEEEDDVDVEGVEMVDANESSHKTNSNVENKTPARNLTSSSKRTPNRSMQQRKRLVSTSLTKSPVIDGAFIDYHDHELKDGQDPFDLKYKLYAVVVSIILFDFNPFSI